VSDSAPVPMIAACHALYQIDGMDSDMIHFAMRKIAYRPASRVRAFLGNIQGRDQEQWAHWFSEFAKSVEPVRSR
jgi:hypothetical protein